MTPVKLKWYGHAAFRITSETGVSIITDPYTPEGVGYPPIREGADLVIVSSETDEAHSRHDLIPGQHTTVNALHVAQQGGQCVALGVPIRAIQAMEIITHPEHEPDQNGMYRFEVDGIQIAHMGDVGNPLTDDQTAFFNDVDVLLALAGDVFTIALDELKRVIDATRPRIVVPMHFRTLTYKPRNTRWIESFLSYFDDSQVDFAFGYEVTLHKANLPEPTRVLVMDYVR
ncbi:MAG: MBL fold metallo-hydrolase [Anaerolineae bacterium]|nr:MBL fold metallo-hydrolase [Anaerolineae bacterium]MDW8171201.1 MBL fold metallo-hydrolase [Anaerolineae bacterium]